MENVTIKHVSKESGYSLSTVSRVLSGSEYPVSEKAKAEIIETAERLGYVSNMLTSLDKGTQPFVVCDG